MLLSSRLSVSHHKKSLCLVTGGPFVLVDVLQVTIGLCLWMIKCHGHGDYYFLIREMCSGIFI